MPPGDAPLIVVGKANHLREWTRAAIDRIRADRPGSLIVDMGWPAPDRAYADLATFGASRAVSAALLHRLAAATP
jgi:beta-N-acetylhexosaminidase